MQEVTESTHAAGYIMRESNGRSRENATLAASQTIAAGSVLAMNTATDQLVELDPAGADGTNVAFGISINAHVTGAGETKDCAYTARDTVVNIHELVYATGVTDTQKATAVSELAALEILARS